jgi:hypothetical protein
MAVTMTAMCGRFSGVSAGSDRGKHRLTCSDAVKCERFVSMILVRGRDPSVGDHLQACDLRLCVGRVGLEPTTEGL